MFNPQALAATGKPGMDVGRVEVSEAEIRAFVRAHTFLIGPSVDAFAAWLAIDWVWNGFADDGDPGLRTNRDVIHSALVSWCGSADPTRCHHGYTMIQACYTCALEEHKWRTEGQETRIGNPPGRCCRACGAATDT